MTGSDGVIPALFPVFVVLSFFVDREVTFVISSLIHFFPLAILRQKASVCWQMTRFAINSPSDAQK